MFATGANPDIRRELQQSAPEQVASFHLFAPICMRKGERNHHSYGDNIGGHDPTDELMEKLDASAVEDDDWFDRVDPGKLERAHGRMPPAEADLIHLRFALHKRQKDIGAIFDRRQTSISYRITRSVRRLKYLVDRPEATEEELRRDLPDLLEAPSTTTARSVHNAFTFPPPPDTPLPARQAGETGPTRCLVM